MSWVCILMGSDSDAAVMGKAADMLDEAGIRFEMTVASAHRTPDRTRDIVEDAEARGAVVFIAGAGGAAHLPGVIASFTTRPVIGVPLSATPLNGFDALLAIVQMPAGIPVASMAIGEAGARNAGIFASEIIAIADKEVAERLQKSRQDMREKVAMKAASVERKTT